MCFQEVRDKEGASWSTLLLSSVTSEQRQLLFDVAACFRGRCAEYALSYWRAKCTTSMASVDELEDVPMLSVHKGNLVMHDIDYDCIHQALRSGRFPEVVDTSRFGRFTLFTFDTDYQIEGGLANSGYAGFMPFGMAALPASSFPSIVVGCVATGGLGLLARAFGANLVSRFKIKNQLMRLPRGVLWLYVVHACMLALDVDLAHVEHLAGDLVVLSIGFGAGFLKNGDLLSKFTRLEHLALRGSGVSAALLGSIPKLSQLRSLRLCLVEFPSLPSMRQLQHLKVVDVSECSQDPRGAIDVPGGCKVLLPKVRRGL